MVFFTVHRRPVQRVIARILIAIASSLGLRAHAGDFIFDFNQGVPAGCVMEGTTHWSATGGVNNSGVLKFTTASPNQGGLFFFPDLEPGKLVSAFTLQLKVYIGGGSNPPADGFYIYFSPAGDGDGLSIICDSFNNGNDGAPAISAYWKNGPQSRVGTPISQGPVGSSFWNVLVKMDQDGTLDMTYNGTPIFNNLAIGFQPQAGARLKFGAQTGALWDNHWMDDIHFVTTALPLSPFESWYDSILPGQGSNAKPDGDYNNDGVSNFLEYAFGMNLLTRGPRSNMPAMEAKDILVYKRRVGSGLAYSLELTHSLNSEVWRTGVSGVDYTEETSVLAGIETVRLHILEPRPLKPRFFRIRVTSP